MFWEKKEDTGNTLVKKEMSRNTEGIMRYTHFADNQKPKDDCCFWKVRLLFNTMNRTADKYIEKTEYSSEEKRKVKVDQPNTIKVYNTNMGGVDLLDNMALCYSITTRNRKWYWPWRLYRKMGMVMGIQDNERMPFLTFIRSCVEMIVVLHGENNTRRIHTLPILSPSTLADIRKDNGNHLVVKTPDRKNVCNNCRKRTLYRCRRCNMGLHPDCFEAYHQ
ncbi:hypothetical protein O3P69_007199 [Scylla paramamosain]|uniref:PiggyBac transposable element-derived protein domain-containing protein n=1 Tax=Scylla paramamosain TaxID=85552 RepID=A0AAW0V1W8_SCYPA